MTKSPPRPRVRRLLRSIPSLLGLTLVACGLAPSPPSATGSASASASSSPLPVQLPTSLLIQRGDAAVADVYLVDQTGAVVAQLTSGPGIKEPVGVSPDGQQFAYRVEAPDATTLPNPDVGLFVERFDDQSRWSFRDKTGLFGHTASWSPDSTRLVVDAQEGSEQRDSLFVIARDGSNLRRLTAHGTDDEYPSWSPDGRQIAFHRSSSVGFLLHLINPDGSADREITHGFRIDEWPVWAPDGKRLAFQSAVAGGIATIELSSGKILPLVPAASGGVPIAWAPMDLIAFTCRGGAWICLTDTTNPTVTAVVEGNFPVWRPSP